MYNVCGSFFPAFGNNLILSANISSLKFHALVVDEIHRGSVGSDQPSPLEVQPGHVSRHVDTSPMRLGPGLTLLGHSLSELWVGTVASDIAVELKEDS